MRDMFDRLKRAILPHIIYSDRKRLIKEIEKIDSNYNSTKESLSNEELYFRLSVLHRKNSTLGILIFPIILLVLDKTLMPFVEYIVNVLISDIRDGIYVGHPVLLTLIPPIAILGVFSIVVWAIGEFPYLICSLSSVNSVIRQHEIDVINSILSERYRKTHKAQHTL